MYNHRMGPTNFARKLRTLALAVTSLVLAAAACHDEPPAAPPGPVACVTAVPCRKGDCEGELFWNGCNACPGGSVAAWSCPDAGSRREAR